MSMSAMKATSDDHDSTRSARDVLRERDALAAELAEARRMSADLLNMISHDIRAPLAVVLGGMKELTSPEVGTLNDDQKFLLGLMSRSGERLTRLAGNILMLARMQQGRMSLSPVRHDLRIVVKRVIDDFTRLDELGKVTIKRVEDDTPVEGNFDADRMVQLVTNVISNAIRFAKKEVRVFVRNAGDSMELVVEDDGNGIPADALPTIFDRLRVKAEGPKVATGLGLTIVKGIVDAHGGKVAAESGPKEGHLSGARFTVTLPKTPTT
jgi:signal transduction histidine kinase